MKVLWVSRHNPLKGQIDALREKLGDDVEVFVLPRQVANAEEVAQAARGMGAAYIVPVLPLSIIARLAELSGKYGFNILFARMEAVATVKEGELVEKIVREKPEYRTAVGYADGTVRVYEFKGFERLKEVKLVTEPF